MSRIVPESPQQQTYHVTLEEAGQTVAAVLRKRQPGTPWSQVQHLIRTRHVMIDGNLCRDEARRLKSGEVVKVIEHSLPPPPREEDVKIRYLDQHIVVVEKPANLTSVRHHEERQWKEERKNAQPTLEELLPRIIAKLERGIRDAKPQKKKRPPGKPDEPRRSGRTPPVRPVHRLDRETSGLMIFARTVPAERHLGIQFRQHTTSRRYIAVAEGKVTAQTITSRLVRDRGDGRRGSTDEEEEGKESVTHVKPLEQLDGYTIIECRLETGRTHQIRIHLAEKGHPLCGERVYRHSKFEEPKPDRSGAPRVALHAAELGFIHPVSDEEMRFTMPLPRDLERFIDQLRKKKSGGKKKEEKKEH